MPVIDILDENGALRWDAAGILEAAVYFPGEPDLRAGYEASWRAEHKALLPSNKRLTQATTHNLARAFAGKPLEEHRAVLRKLRIRIERIGAALWLEAALSQTDRGNATESKVSYILSELGKREGIKASRSTIRRDWVSHRGVVHLCAAIAYQRMIFGAPFPCHPLIGPPDYSTHEALWDFLRLAHQFFAFAQDSGCFSATPSFDPDRHLWVLPAGLRAIAPKRQIGWPDCHRIRAIAPHDIVLAPLTRYDSSDYRT